MKSSTLRLVALATLSVAGSASAGTIIATGQNNGDSTHSSGLFYYSIDTTTGKATPLAPITGGNSAALAATPDGHILGIRSGQLIQINPNTAAATNIGSPSTLSPTGFDVLSDGRAFATPFESGFGASTQTQNLYSVDLTTGQYTPVSTGRTVGDAVDLARGTASGTAAPFIISLGSVANTLYGVDLDTNSLIGLNPATGAASVIGAVGAVRAAGLPVYSGFAALTGVDENADGTFDTLYGNVNFADPDGPGGVSSSRLGGLARYDLTDGTWDLVGTNPGLIFFGFASTPIIPEPTTLSLLAGAGLLALRRRK
jgi:hypothetical protein